MTIELFLALQGSSPTNLELEQAGSCPLHSTHTTPCCPCAWLWVLGSCRSLCNCFTNFSTSLDVGQLGIAAKKVNGLQVTQDVSIKSISGLHLLVRFNPGSKIQNAVARVQDYRVVLEEGGYIKHQQSQLDGVSPNLSLLHRSGY